MAGKLKPPSSRLQSKQHVIVRDTSFFSAQEGSVRLALNEGSVLGFSYTVPPTDVKLL